MPRMVEVVVDSVRVSLTNQQRIIILRDVNDERYLPIWIGAYEAEAITIALQEIELARPQTHDLMKNILTSLDARLLRVEIISLQDDVFYGNLVVEVNNSVINIDTRPSDSLALAVRAHVPVMVSEEIMEQAGIIPEEEIENMPDDEASEEKEEPETDVEDRKPILSGDERLSVFENFLENLDVGVNDDMNIDDEEEEDDDDDLPDLNPG